MNTNETENKYFLPVAVVVAGILIAGAVVWNGSRPAAAPTGTGSPEVPVVNIKNVDIEGRPFIGQTNAPITIAFWSDFQCPFCKRFAVETLPQIIKNYVDTGKVKLVFMENPFLGNDSVDAALYSQSVWKLYPAKYLEWSNAIYAAQDEEGDKGFGNAASIDKLNATISGIDAAKVAADVKANTSAYQENINADKAEAQKVGLTATPSFVIGTEAIAGAYPFERFQTAIDALLK